MEGTVPHASSPTPPHPSHTLSVMLRNKRGGRIVRLTMRGGKIVLDAALIAKDERVIGAGDIVFLCGTGDVHLGNTRPAEVHCQQGIRVFVGGQTVTVKKRRIVLPPRPADQPAGSTHQMSPSVA